MLKKAGRFLASRLQGSKGKRKYDSWMKRNPWASTALGAGDLALAFYAPTALRGAGKLIAGKAPVAGSLRSTAGNLLQRGGNLLGGAPRSASMTTASGASVPALPVRPNATMFNRGSQALQGGVEAAQKAGRYLLDPKNALVTGQVLTGAERAYTNATQRRLDEQDREERLRIQRRMAEYLMPMFTGTFGPPPR